MYSMAERSRGADVVLSCPGCAGAKKNATAGGSPISEIANGAQNLIFDGEFGNFESHNRLDQ